MGLGKKKLHVRSYGMSRFVEHFNQLKGHQFFVKASDMQDLHKQLSVVQNFSKQLNASGMSEESAIGGMFAGYGGLGISSFTTGTMLGGGLTMGGLAGMAVFGELVAGPAIAILGAVSADKKADAIIDQFQAIEKRVLEIMKRQMDSLESGCYDVKMIQSRQKDLENLFKNGSPGGLKDKGL
ncbi:hypothetical protein V5H63_04060 [Helicobacter pylori]